MHKVYLYTGKEVLKFGPGLNYTGVNGKMIKIDESHLDDPSVKSCIEQKLIKLVTEKVKNEKTPKPEPVVAKPEPVVAKPEPKPEPEVEKTTKDGTSKEKDAASFRERPRSRRE